MLETLKAIVNVLWFFQSEFFAFHSKVKIGLPKGKLLGLFLPKVFCLLKMIYLVAGQ